MTFLVPVELPLTPAGDGVREEVRSVMCQLA